jgi:heat shock protein HslJ
MSRAAAVLIVVALLAGLTLAGCSSDKPSARGSVEKVEWRLATAQGQDMSAFKITATFDQGTISGFSGVNSYAGPCTLGDDGSLKLGELISTLMAGTPEQDAAEQKYMGLLQASSARKYEDSQLVLLDAEGAEQLRFQR